MIIVPIKEGENIEKALKKFKRKFEKTGVVRELRSRKQFEKPSVKRRNAQQKAVRETFREEKKRDQEGYLRTASQTERGVSAFITHTEAGKTRRCLSGFVVS